MRETRVVPAEAIEQCVPLALKAPQNGVHEAHGPWLAELAGAFCSGVHGGVVRRALVPQLVQTEQELLAALDYARRLQDAPAEVRSRAEALAEILAYFVPWFDNMLDTASGPAAVLAGDFIGRGKPHWNTQASAISDMLNPQSAATGRRASTPRSKSACITLPMK